VVKKEKSTTEDTEEHREKTSEKLCVLCGKKEKPTTEYTEKHRERNSEKLCVLCGKKRKAHHNAKIN
jgi:hypothetical protein